MTYDPTAVYMDDIKKTIEEFGYQFLGVGGEESVDIEMEARERYLGGNEEETHRGVAVRWGTNLHDVPLDFRVGLWDTR